MRIVADFIGVGLHPWQAPDADHFGLERIGNIQRPDHALGPARCVVRHEGELALEIDAETVRAGARHVVEADRLRRRRRRNVEDEKAGARVLALVAGEPLGIHVKQIVADDAQLVAVNAGRRAELADLVRLFRIAHVVDGKAFRAVIARAADRADISVALVDLNQSAAAPRRRRVVADEPEIFGFFGIGGGHGHSLFTSFDGAIVVGQIDVTLRIGWICAAFDFGTQRQHVLEAGHVEFGVARKTETGLRHQRQTLFRDVLRHFELVDQNSDGGGAIVRIERPAQGFDIGGEIIDQRVGVVAGPGPMHERAAGLIGAEQVGGAAEAVHALGGGFKREWQVENSAGIVLVGKQRVQTKRAVADRVERIVRAGFEPVIEQDFLGLQRIGGIGGVDDDGVAADVGKVLTSSCT